MANPRPTPTRIKKLKGNPGKRPLPKKEPKPDSPTRLPNAPGHLSKVGKAEWRRMGKQLFTLGLLSNIDLSAFGAYCQQYATWVEASEQVQKHGMLIKAQSGFPMQSPYFSIQAKAQAEMRKWLVEFGMTPSSRSRVEVDKRKAEDPMEAFFKGGGIKAVK